MNWSPIQTEKQRPADNQRVFYFFAPSGRWFVGQYCDEHQTGGFFMGRFGSCDWQDAPYWHPEPPAPSNENG